MKIYMVQIYKEFEDGEAYEKGYITEQGIPVIFDKAQTAARTASIVTNTMNEQQQSFNGTYGFRLVEGETL